MHGFIVILLGQRDVGGTPRNTRNILAHNHPSGVAEPSAADAAITRRIVDAAALIDVRVLDHLVVGEREAVSMAALGML